MSYSALPNERVKAANGVDYAYRDTGPAAGDGVPLVLFQHFRGNLDNWDPALVDVLASERRVIAFDNAGVAGSTGTTPNTAEQIAYDAIAFVEAMGFEWVDLLGFSIGSFVAQGIALIRPDLVRRIVLASAAPQGAEGMHGWAPDVIRAVGGRDLDPGGYLDVFFTPTSREGANRRSHGCSREPENPTRQRAGRHGRLSTTRSARGASQPLAAPTPRRDRSAHLCRQW
jgi:pimeloyl-ACP methyl ester carboxylesterase